MRGEFRREGHARLGATVLREECAWLPDGVVQVVEEHHSPREWTASLVALADHLSAGERVPDPSQEERIESLLSPFAWVGYEGEPEKVGESEGARYFPLEPLKADTTALFPQGTPPAPHSAEQGYEALGRGLGKEMRDLAGLHQDPFARLETWLHLLQRWLWCVPAAGWRAIPDTSLYEHLRTTAGLALVLWQWTEAQNSAKSKVESLLKEGKRSPYVEEPVAGLLHGDLSGLQAFLYRVSSRGALRGLKGRSFYLQALCDVVARWVLDRLGLPLCNLLYSGGGHFFILTPRPELIPIDDLRSDVSERLFYMHGPDLFLALGLVPVMPGHLWGGFGEVWHSAGEAAREEKSRRFSRVSSARLMAGVFGPNPAEKGDPSLTCAGCRRESARLAPDTGLCPFCQSLQSLGQALRRPGFLLLERVEPAPLVGHPEPRPWDGALEVFGTRPRYLAGWQVGQLPAAVKGTLLSLGDPEALARSRRWLQGRPSLALGYVTYASATPFTDEEEGEGQVMDFQELAGRAEGLSGLGVLRMDVDNLGRLFTGQGPPQSPPPSLGRMATLSFLMRLFFEMEVARLCREANEGGREKTYLIYSGGDDLFLVASWSLAPRLASRIRERMRAFFGPSLTASAGVLVDSPDVPLYHLAQEALAYLERSKSWERNGRAKDAITFLNPYWTQEWGALEEAGKRAGTLVKGVREGGLPRALLFFLQRLEDIAEQRFRGKPTYRWQWLSAYYLGRLQERLGGRRSALPVVSGLWKELVAQGHADPEAPWRWARIARWAELLTRSGQGGAQ